MATGSQTVDVPLLCEVYNISSKSVSTEGLSNANCELLVAADVLHLTQDASAGLTLRVGSLDLYFGTRGQVIQIVETASYWAFLFPHPSSEAAFSVQVYPRDGEREHLDALIAFFDQIKSIADDGKESSAQVSQKAIGSGVAAKITSGGEWFAKKIVQSGSTAASYIDKKGKEYVEGKNTKDVRVSEQTQARLDLAQQGANCLKVGAAKGLSFAVAGFKTVGRKAAEVNRRTGALDKLAAEASKRTGVSQSSSGGGKGQVVVDVGSASIDAALDVYHAIKLAADVVTDQSERTAVQVAGDLYGEEVRTAAKSGVGAVADVGRAGAKVLQFAGDEVEVALECAIEFVDQTVSLNDYLAATPICEGPMKRQDPMTFNWFDRHVSLSKLGLLVFADKDAMQAKEPNRPPLNMMSADDLLAVETEAINTVIVRTRDHVIHRFELHDGSRDSWYESIVSVQQGSRRFKALSANRT